MVIGICGFKGSGKSTVARHLVKEYGFRSLNFKGAIIAEIIRKFPDVLDELKRFYNAELHELFETKPPIVRALLQNYGTEVRRCDDENYWVDKWIERVNEEGERDIVTDDVRFFNELTAIKGMNGILIRVKRDDIATGGKHKTETEQESFHEDFTIEATKGNHESVYKQIDSIIDTLKSNVD